MSPADRDYKSLLGGCIKRGLNADHQTRAQGKSIENNYTDTQSITGACLVLYDSRAGHAHQPQWHQSEGSSQQATLWPMASHCRLRLQQCLNPWKKFMS
jgi:hypothetical protein